MALKTCTEPSTGHTIHATQVLDLKDEDFAALLKDKAVGETDADVTADVGALAMKGGK